ncbi:hypothetical protein TNCV_3014281 [Trichonephila clavipes]|nr:hypothetical protein TNCV_3014281 [Trichonephila clavipes]
MGYHWMKNTSVIHHQNEMPLHHSTKCTRQAINPSEIWPAPSSCADWLRIEDSFSGAFVHSDNVTCPFNSLYFDEVDNVRFLALSIEL